MASILKSLRVLSDSVRLRLMLLLVEEELMVAELQEILGLAQSRISTQLAQLKSEDLVSDRRVGKNIFYSAAEDLGSATLAVLEAAREELAAMVTVSKLALPARVAPATSTRRAPLPPT